jgi:hypothetical protein
MLVFCTANGFATYPYVSIKCQTWIPTEFITISWGNQDGLPPFDRWNDLDSNVGTYVTCYVLEQTHCYPNVQILLDFNEMWIFQGVVPWLWWFSSLSLGWAHPLPPRVLFEHVLTLCWRWQYAQALSLHHHSWWAYHPRDHIYRFLLTLNQVYESLLAPFGCGFDPIPSPIFMLPGPQAPRPIPPWNWPQSRSVLLPDQLSLLASLVTHDQNAIECRYILYITNKKNIKK